MNNFSILYIQLCMKIFKKYMVMRRKTWQE